MNNFNCDTDHDDMEFNLNNDQPKIKKESQVVPRISIIPSQ